MNIQELFPGEHVALGPISMNPHTLEPYRAIRVGNRVTSFSIETVSDLVLLGEFRLILEYLEQLDWISYDPAIHTGL